MLITLCDIYSNFKKKLYASKGEKLKLISTHGSVLIVEGKKERFPVQKSKVREI